MKIPKRMLFKLRYFLSRKNDKTDREVDSNEFAESKSGSKKEKVNERLTDNNASNSSQEN